MVGSTSAAIQFVDRLGGSGHLASGSICWVIGGKARRGLRGTDHDDYWTDHLLRNGECLFLVRLDCRHRVLSWPPAYRALQGRDDLFGDPNGTTRDLGDRRVVHHALYREEAGLNLSSDERHESYLNS